jgi:glycerate 2-kinase
VVSDVPGDDVGAVSSGPCAPDPLDTSTLNAVLHSQGVWDRLPSKAQTHLAAVEQGHARDTLKPGNPVFQHVETRTIAGNHQALSAAASWARAAGIEEVTIEPALLAGEAAICGVRLASDLISRRRRARGPRISRCVLWGGETTVTFTAAARSAIASLTSPPLGGRSQELALAAARSLGDAGQHATGIALLAAGTDGRDGPTDAAGAIIDGSTWAAIAAAGCDPIDSLARHDAYHALDSVGALIRPGLSGTNVMDVVIGLIL